jgi:hypothetical protein
VTKLAAFAQQLGRDCRLGDDHKGFQIKGQSSTSTTGMKFEVPFCHCSCSLRKADWGRHAKRSLTAGSRLNKTFRQCHTDLVSADLYGLKKHLHRVHTEPQPSGTNEWNDFERYNLFERPFLTLHLDGQSGLAEAARWQPLSHVENVEDLGVRDASGQLSPGEANFSFPYIIAFNSF